MACTLINIRTCNLISHVCRKIDCIKIPIARMHLSRIVILSDLNLLRIILWKCENFLTVLKAIFRFKRLSLLGSCVYIGKRFRYHNEPSSAFTGTNFLPSRPMTSARGSVCYVPRIIIKKRGTVLMKPPQTVMRTQPLASAPRRVIFLSLLIHRKELYKRNIFYHYLVISLELLKDKIQSISIYGICLCYLINSIAFC